MTDPTVIQCLVAAGMAVALVLVMAGCCWFGEKLGEWAKDVRDE